MLLSEAEVYARSLLRRRRLGGLSSGTLAFGLLRQSHHLSFV